MGNLGRKDYGRQKKIRALNLIKMFKKKIELGVFDVELANWWSSGMSDIVILRIDVKVNDMDVLEELGKLNSF